MSLIQISATIIETCPFETFWASWRDHDVVYLRPEYEHLPAAFVAAARAVFDQPDAVRCAGCDAPVGLVLGGDPERLHWEITALASQDDGPVTVLCEQCTPYVPAAATKETGQWRCPPPAAPPMHYVVHEERPQEDECDGGDRP